MNTQLSITRAMEALDRFSSLWTMTCMDGAVLVSASHDHGTVGVSRPCRIEALNACLVALRLAREDAIAERKAAA
jgi:hypothetical protein